MSSYNPRYGNASGRVGKKDFSVDGKSFEYRNPENFNAGGNKASNEPTYNRHSSDMTNPLYDYSYGQIRDAAKAEGIGNVNTQDEVDRIIGRIQNPPAPEKPKKDKPKRDDAKLAAPTEPVKTVLSKPAAEANAFVEAHNAMTMGNKIPLAGIAASNQAGVSSPEAGSFKNNFQLNLGSGGNTPLTFTEGITGTKPTIASGFMATYKDAIKKNLEPM
tara:strand:- start:86 stop:736 length:651 start_codon:yes stop_codon:yes gene_type:complete